MYTHLYIHNMIDMSLSLSLSLLAQRVPSICLASSFRTCLDSEGSERCVSLEDQVPITARYALSRGRKQSVNSCMA